MEKATILNDYINQLTLCELFTGLQVDETASLLKNTELKVTSYSKGDMVRASSQAINSPGVILEGVLDLGTNIESGKYINFLYKKEGEIFGAESLFSREDFSAVQITAAVKSEVLYLPEAKLFELIANNQRVNKNLLSILSRSIFRLNTKIELLADTSIQRKIAYTLLYNADASGTETVKLLVSRQAWAEHLNISRPSLSREIGKMEAEGIISINGKEITIINREKLEEINSV